MFAKQVSEVRFESGVRAGELYTGLSLSERVTLRLAIDQLLPLAVKWSMADTDSKLASGKPVYILGRRVNAR